MPLCVLGREMSLRRLWALLFVDGAHHSAMMTIMMIWWSWPSSSTVTSDTTGSATSSLQWMASPPPPLPPFLWPNDGNALWHLPLNESLLLYTLPKTVVNGGLGAVYVCLSVAIASLLPRLRMHLDPFPSRHYC